MDKAKLSKLRHDGHITDAEYKEMISLCDRDQELIRKFREAQKGHRVDGGFYRGVSACLRIVLNEYEIPEPPVDFETRGCCQ